MILHHPPIKTIICLKVINKSQFNHFYIKYTIPSLIVYHVLFYQFYFKHNLF